jgi:hypothetical protein
MTWTWPTTPSERSNAPPEPAVREVAHLNSVRAHSALRLVILRKGNHVAMIILGLVLLIIGIIVSSAILYTIGIILLIVGLILMLVGRSGTMVAGRRHYW